MSRDHTEVMNIKVRAGSRTLYVDVKENAGGGRFVSLRELRAGAEDERSRILVDEAFVPALLRALRGVAAFLRDERPRKSAPSATRAERRQAHPRAYEPWTDEEEQQLKEGHARGCGVGELARQLQRKPSAVRSRLHKLGVEMPDEPG